jgi:hypothetical protein
MVAPPRALRDYISQAVDLVEQRRHVARVPRDKLCTLPRHSGASAYLIDFVARHGCTVAVV